MHITGAHFKLHVDERLHAGEGLVTVRQPKQSFLLTGMRSERTEGRYNDGAFIHSRQDCQHPRRMRQRHGRTGVPSGSRVCVQNSTTS